MNFLSHLYLSGNDSEIKIGNFIGDFVKGNSYLNYTPNIQQGILLHRKIDSYTDKHQVTKELCTLFKEKYSRHSGIVIDIIYDHFLCKNWNTFSNQLIENYISGCYKILLKNYFILPAQVKKFLPVMISNNRLLSYSRLEGIEKALEQMARYTSLPAESKFAMFVMKENYQFINDKFLLFFNDAILFVEKDMGSMNYSQKAII